VTTKQPIVTVLIVNWNGKDVTLDCLASLRQVTYPAMRILLVDNGSHDDTLPVVRARYPGVSILALGENKRFAGGNNRGMQVALDEGSDFVLLLNNDTTVAPDFLTHLVDRFMATERCGMVAPKIYYYTPADTIWFAGGDISFWTGTMSHRGIREVDNGQFDTAREIGYATGCCILVSAEVIRRVGMLDHSYFIYGEDADWSIRVQDAGYKVMYEPRSKVWHKLSVSTGGHLSSFKLRNKAISMYRFFAHHARWYHWFTFPWLSVPVNIWAGIRYLVSTRKHAHGQISGHGHHSSPGTTPPEKP
jgi:GT2 family glycosyltransferase